MHECNGNYTTLSWTDFYLKCTNCHHMVGKQQNLDDYNIIRARRVEVTCNGLLGLYNYHLSHTKHHTFWYNGVRHSVNEYIYHVMPQHFDLKKLRQTCKDYGIYYTFKSIDVKAKLNDLDSNPS